MTDRLRAIFCDHLSLIRGKYLPASKIGDDDTRFCRSTFGVHFDRDLLPSPGSMMLEGLPDMELRWHAADIRDSWHAGTKIVLGDLYDQSGTALQVCPRGALKRAIAAWADKGLTPKIGIELEAFAFQRADDGTLVPYDAPGAVVYGTGPTTDPRGFNDAIWDRASALGFNLDMITAEYDAPQFEYTLSFDDALKAVDDIILFRLLAREVALEHGIILSFLPKPIEEAGGSGMHINFSFTDANGNNALSMDGKSGPDHMNDLARGCVAGLVHHHRGLAALVAPTALSYKRLQPASLSGYWRNWGGDHRNVTTRVSAEGGTKSRLEHRMADASANPYIAVAAVLHAALLGVENGYALPTAETGDGFELTDATEGVAADLTGAIADLSADAALGDAVGRMLVDNQLFMREAEVEKTANLDHTALRDFYIPFL
ncbi:glutamine synthetase family protein [uncultured Sulfitobacter sp.]|uniref:glutamine synthetase family protein n=1 Tax=uncultured Sulfitobacter sp. TaxID=191468 RepID=UPI002613192E|nr:glutamine synthetase family protein [uncultured Sulfitobacter sp.]